MIDLPGRKNNTEKFMNSALEFGKWNENKYSWKGPKPEQSIKIN